jgi:hypothetical protein
METDIDIAIAVEKKFCSDALFVQDACNLSGVLHSFVANINKMRNDTGYSWDAIDNHPATRLFVDKIASLTGMQNLCGEEYTEKYARAYQFCQTLAGE